jgi:hypothetical protein
MEEIDQTPEGTEAAPLETETAPAQPIVEPTVPAIDYEKKFADSTRENQLLQARLAEQARVQQELTKEPTDSELRTAFPSWELMSDTEKELARRTVRAEHIGGNAAQLAQDIQADRSWNTSVELVLASNTALQGKEQAFRQYASKPQYKNIPMEVLVDAFLQKSGSAPAAPVTTPKPGLETGNGGPRTPDKPKQISAPELSALRKSDEKAYMAYVRTHDIDVDNL